LFSSELGYEVLQGQAFSLLHFDEDTPEEMFHEGRQRIKTVPNSSIILTGTPLHGDLAWEQRIVAKAAAEGGKANMVDEDDPDSQTLVSMHTISMYDAGLVPHALIKAEEKLMDEFERKARIYGEPMPLTKNPVFDRIRLQDMRREHTATPDRGELKFTGILSQLSQDNDFRFESDGVGDLRVWERPVPGAVYLASVDTAAGLIAGDASCCSILKCTADGLGVKMEMVAQYHARINPLEYADKIVPVAYWYNTALVVIELTGGLGRASMLRVREHFYPNLYREQKALEVVEGGPTARLGVETNQSTKPFMVAALQQFIREKRIVIHCDATIHELVAFEQVRQGAGGAMLSSPKYQGANGTHDDRVMSLAIACATALSYPQLIYDVQDSAERVILAAASARTSKEMSSVYNELQESRLASEELL
jgi:phage terminase large subunit-like protein